MPITITLLNLFASLLFALLHVFISINCNALVGSAQCSIYSHSVHSIQRISTSTPNQPLFSRSTPRFFFMKGAFQISLISILFILLGFCITELHWNYHWNYHSTLTLCNCITRFDLNSLNGHALQTQIWTKLRHLHRNTELIKPKNLQISIWKTTTQFQSAQSFQLQRTLRQRVP